jgi:hypothetical protein
MRRGFVAAIVVIGAALLAGCSFLAPEPSPPGPHEMPEPIGPVVEIGRGESARGPWRYTVYESQIGTCTRIEFLDVGGEGPSSCGGTLRVEPPGAAVSLLGVGSGTGAPWTVEGTASDDVAQLWIEVSDGGRVPVVPLMSLEPAGLDGQIFYVELPDDRRPRALVAIDTDGETLSEVPIDAP